MLRHISPTAYKRFSRDYEGPHMHWERENRDEGLLGRLHFMPSSVRMIVFQPSVNGPQLYRKVFDDSPFDASDEDTRELFRQTVMEHLKDHENPLQFSAIEIHDAFYQGTYVLEARAASFTPSATFELPRQYQA